MSNKIIIRGHLGLGDHIICNGLVRHFSKNGQLVLLPCKSHNFDSVSAMFADDKYILPLAFVDDKAATEFTRLHLDKYDTLQLGAFNSARGFNPTLFDQEFYQQADVPWHVRWSGFKLPDKIKRIDYGVALDEPFAFIHDKPGVHVVRRKLIPKMPCIHPDFVSFGGCNIIQFVPALEKATEIHCINSCFLNLVESMDTIPSTTRLVFHRYARKPHNDPSLRKGWEIID